MNLVETNDLLTLIAGVDNRRIDDAMVMVWREILADLSFADCRAAVVQHLRTSDDYLMPVHVRRAAVDIDRERRRTVREAAEAERRALEARPPVTTDRSREVRDAARATLPKGDPDKLRWGHKHWRELQRDEQRRREAKPNPDFAGYPRAVEPSDVEGEAS